MFDGQQGRCFLRVGRRDNRLVVRFRVSVLFGAIKAIRGQFIISPRFSFTNGCVFAIWVVNFVSHCVELVIDFFVTSTARKAVHTMAPTVDPVGGDKKKTGIRRLFVPFSSGHHHSSDSLSKRKSQQPSSGTSTPSATLEREKKQTVVETAFVSSANSSRNGNVVGGRRCKSVSPSRRLPDTSLVLEERKEQLLRGLSVDTSSGGGRSGRLSAPPLQSGGGSSPLHHHHLTATLGGRPQSDRLLMTAPSPPRPRSVSPAYYTPSPSSRRGTSSLPRQSIIYEEVVYENQRAARQHQLQQQSRKQQQQIHQQLDKRVSFSPEPPLCWPARPLPPLPPSATSRLYANVTGGGHYHYHNQQRQQSPPSPQQQHVSDTDSEAGEIQRILLHRAASPSHSTRLTGVIRTVLELGHLTPVVLATEDAASGCIERGFFLMPGWGVIIRGVTEGPPYSHTVGRHSPGQPAVRMLIRWKNKEKSSSTCASSAKSPTSGGAGGTSSSSSSSSTKKKRKFGREGGSPLGALRAAARPTGGSSRAERVRPRELGHRAGRHPPTTANRRGASGRGMFVWKQCVSLGEPLWGRAGGAAAVAGPIDPPAAAAAALSAPPPVGRFPSCVPSVLGVAGPDMAAPPRRRPKVGPLPSPRHHPGHGPHSFILDKRTTPHFDLHRVCYVPPVI
ncbi:hypothetical protein AAG570_005097 [Ranatra chinensis]|uniref:Uncharacterized protein n=1 Tax=Ranatra chinensis TaxID=642074 RepID=A0ABD0Y121_9HEMI